MPQFEQSVDYKIGARIHTLMWHAKVTQTNLAKLLGVQQSAVSKKLRGERSFSAEELLTIAQHFGVSVAVLFGEKENGPTGESGRSNESLHTESNRRPFHYNPNTRGHEPASNVYSLGAQRRKMAVAR